MSEPTSPVSFYDLLSNSLILLSICPLLSLQSILALTGTSRAISELIWKTPQVFKRLDLSTHTMRHQYSGGHHAARFTPNDNMYYPLFQYAVSNCLSGLGRKTSLQSISIMILDGFSATELVLNAITGHLNVRLLSIRGTRHRPSIFQNFLGDLIKPSHPNLKLKGLYCFGPDDRPLTRHAAAGSPPPASANTGIMSTPGAQLGARAPVPSQESGHYSENSSWYDGNGEVSLPGLGARDTWQSWAVAVNACAGIIAFDVISCRRCPIATEDNKTVPRLANISLKGCKVCGSCPEGPACVGKSPESYLPLLAPVPLYSPTVKVAQIPPSEILSASQLIARCEQCLKGRWCRNCNAWWCESCYMPPRVLNEDEDLQVKSSNGSIKVHLGLCVDQCLVSELYSGAGEGGMWG